MRRFDACALCLQRARDPVACQKGHMFCKECVYTDLGMSSIFVRLHLSSPGVVTQLSDIKRQKVKLEALKKEAEDERQRAREAARERVLLDFERGQLGLAAGPGVTTSGSDSKERQWKTSHMSSELTQSLVQLVERKGSLSLTRRLSTNSRRKQRMRR